MYEMSQQFLPYTTALQHTQLPCTTALHPTQLPCTTALHPAQLPCTTALHQLPCTNSAIRLLIQVTDSASHSPVISYELVEASEMTGSHVVFVATCIVVRQN